MLSRLLVLSLAFLAMGCSTAGQVANKPVNLVTLSQRAYEAKTGYDLALVWAIAYAKQPRCTAPGAPPAPACSDTAVLDAMQQFRVAASASTQGAENAVRSMTDNTTVAEALVKGAEAAVVAFSTIAKTYGDHK